LFVIIVIRAYFIYISQGSVEMHLRCGWIYNSYFIATCPQSVSVKELWKSLNNWRRYGQKWSATFFMAHPVDRDNVQASKTSVGWQMNAWC